jgi:hypothetical protein
LVRALERVIGGDDDAEEVVGPGSEVMGALVPPGRRALERLVIRLLALLDELLEADVAPDLVAADVEEPEADQPRHAPVAVAEGVDDQEVQDVGGREQQRRVHAGLKRAAEPGMQRLHCVRGLLR